MLRRGMVFLINMEPLELFRQRRETLFMLNSSQFDRHAEVVSMEGRRAYPSSVVFELVMSSVSALRKVDNDNVEGPAPELAPQAVDEMLEAANRIERAAKEIQALNAILKQVDKNVTAAAKRAVKRAGSWPLRLNSRQAKRGL